MRRDRWSARVTAIGAAVVLIASAGGAALYFHLGRAPVVSQMPDQLAKASERFSIVVLPFANLSGDASQDYLADVISDELTTAFSRSRDTFVISRWTAFTYKGKPIDVRQIGKDLGVRYVLEGSVQPSGDRLRVHAQFIDTESDAHLWADQFDENRSDLLPMQDAIVARIAHGIGLKFIAERARSAQTRAANPSAEDLAWRCTAAFMRMYLTPVLDSAYRLCEQALQIDPENVRALSLLSIKFSHRVYVFASSDRQADLRRADELASLAIKIDPDYFLAHSAKGDVLLVAGRSREAIDSYQRALMLAPSSIPPGLALAYSYAGEPERPSPMPTRRYGSVRTTPFPHQSISPRPSPSASCRTMRRRLYGLTGLKRLLPRYCSSDLCGQRCLPWRVKRQMRAQQCSATWRTTMPLSGPSLNGKLDGKAYRCPPIVRVFLCGG
jgi:TolB-like protein